MPTKTERSVDHQYLIRKAPGEVFRALTEAGWLTRWLCDTAEITPRKGGMYRLGWTDGPTHAGAIVEFTPGSSIALAWSWPNVELRGTVFTLSVEPHEHGTIFHVTHTGFPREERWADLYGGAEWGWTYFAMNLKSVLEHGFDLRAKQDG